MQPHILVHLLSPSLLSMLKAKELIIGFLYIYYLSPSQKTLYKAFDHNRANF